MLVFRFRLKENKQNCLNNFFFFFLKKATAVFMETWKRGGKKPYITASKIPDHLLVNYKV